jgi:divalent metal cation (Fe/Co/Zn/Cd) transporter
LTLRPTAAASSWDTPATRADYSLCWDLAGYRYTAADAAAAAGVAVAGAVILATGGLFWLDPAVAFVIALVVGYHAVRLLGVITTALRAPSPPSVGTNPLRHMTAQ